MRGLQPGEMIVLAARPTTYVEGLVAFREGRVGEWIASFAGAASRAALMSIELADRVASLQGEWRERFAHWMEQGTPDHLLKASIFFDLRPLWGDPAPAEALRDFVLQKASQNPRFRRQMAANALRAEPPLGLIQDFALSGTGERAGTIDLKTHGTTPFVDGARILALTSGVRETNTLARLRGCAARKAIRADEAAAWGDAYAFILLQRTRNLQAQQRADRQPVDNRLNPNDLNELDRRILKETFRQARKLQSRLKLDYQLSL
jgi:CBS domain-containing protein